MPSSVKAPQPSGLIQPGLPTDASLIAKAKTELLNLAQTLPAGASLPTYAELSKRLGCSLAPIKQAARELQLEGRLSLQRGRPARVLWNNSFSRSSQAQGKNLATRAVELSYRPLSPLEQSIGEEMGLAPGGACIVCERLRIVDGRPTALQTAYINPGLFADPPLFFLQHDVVAGSLSQVYVRLGLRPLSVTAVLKPALADERERRLLELTGQAPVLRSRQRTMVDNNGRAEVLEIMIASYTQDIDYTVERLPRWAGEAAGHG